MTVRLTNCIDLSPAAKEADEIIRAIRLQREAVNQYRSAPYVRDEVIAISANIAKIVAGGMSIRMTFGTGLDYFPNLARSSTATASSNFLNNGPG
jgi:hypothetical protein